VTFDCCVKKEGGALSCHVNKFIPGSEIAKADPSVKIFSLPRDVKSVVLGKSIDWRAMMM
jgi:hypothetical protein